MAANPAKQCPSDPTISRTPLSAPINFRRLLGYLRPYRGRMLLALAALLAHSLVSLGFPLVVVQLVDSILKERSFAMLNSLAGGLVLIFLLSSGLAYLEMYNLTYIGEGIVVNLRTSLYAHLHSLALDFYSHRRVGELVSRISNDVTQVRTVLTSTVTDSLGQVLTLFGAVGLVFWLHAQLTLFLLLLVPAIAAIAIGFGRPLQKLSTRLQDELAQSTVAVEEGLQGVRVVKSFTREAFEIDRYRTAMMSTFKAAIRLAVMRSGFFAMMSFLGFSAVVALLWFGAREVLAGRLTIGQISGFTIYGVTIAGCIGGLAAVYGQVRQALGAVRRVFEILDTKPSIEDAPNALTLPVVVGRLRFDHVCFSYDNRTPVLQDIQMEIAPGEIVALVGPSGAGKSTLFNLIPRFYDPTSGSVRIDDYDVRGATQQSLRAQIGIVLQDTHLFGGTIRENIAYGRLQAAEAEIIAAAQAANAHAFIMALPDQYATIVGERGVKLSGGERQRIAIARALLKDPRILLLDEATSALDSESEELVQEALHRLMQGRTTVIIAHRLSTVKIAHQIAVLERGRLADFGTHEQLMARDGLYRKLYQMQFRDLEVEKPGTPEASPTAPRDQPAGEAPPTLGAKILDKLVGRP